MDKIARELEWVAGTSPRTFVANSILGTYKVMDANPSSDFIEPGWSKDGGGFVPTKTIEAARAAAQADYEHRIRSALSPALLASPVSTALENARLREAVKEFKRAYDNGFQTMAASNFRAALGRKP